MTDYADWNDTHFDTLDWDGYEDMSDWEYHMQMQDWDDREDDGWSERYDYPDEEFIGGEDAYLDSYWEDMGEVGAGYEPPF